MDVDTIGDGRARQDDDVDDMGGYEEENGDACIELNDHLDQGSRHGGEKDVRNFSIGCRKSNITRDCERVWQEVVVHYKSYDWIPPYGRVTEHNENLGIELSWFKWCLGSPHTFGDPKV